MRRTIVLVAAFSMLVLAWGEAVAAFVDPLDVPAIKTPRAASSRLTGAVLAGSNRFVVVGQLGRILVSTDAGRNWTQADVPLSADLVAVDFPASGKIGWTCGHYDTILRSDDGGLHWRRQLDGRSVEKLIKTYYQQKLDAGDTSVSHQLQDAQLNFADGASLPFLDVSFENEQKGFVVGAFGTILATDDGGVTWTPWMDRVDNPDGLHLNAISRIGDQVYIASEQGTVFHLDPASQRFVRTFTGYRGTFFGLVGNSNAVIAFGLRGHVYRSADQGKNWRSIPLGTEANIVAGTRLNDGMLVLADQEGGLWVSANGGESFSSQPGMGGNMLTDVVAAGDRRLLLVGERGVQVGVLK